jgi:hypothetical protein
MMKVSQPHAHSSSTRAGSGHASSGGAGQIHEQASSLRHTRGLEHEARFHDVERGRKTAGATVCPFLCAHARCLASLLSFSLSLPRCQSLFLLVLVALVFLVAVDAQAPAGTPAAVGDGTTVGATPCAAMEISAESSPISKLKERVERSMVEAGSDTTAKERSGSQWVARFPGSKSLSSLSPSWGPKARAFIGAIQAAGGRVTINAVYRPPERSYLMYNAWRIAKGAVAPRSVPAYAGVNIDWTHGGNAAAARTAARNMCSSYGISYTSSRQKVAPAGSSRHNHRGAVDMNITNYVGKSIKNPKGARVRVNSFSQLVALGAQYGVKYFSGENMHWSDTGH